MTGTIRSLILAAVITAATGCATTIVEDTSLTVPESTSTSTTVLPEDLTTTLETLIAQMSTLSELVVETTGGITQDRLASIEALWEQARRELEVVRPDVIDDMQRMIDMSRLAVERRRPAEADKAVSFLAPVVANVISSL